MEGEMVCVHRASSVSEADIVAAWLGEHGIPAFVKNRLTAETLPIDCFVTKRGIEVCVADNAVADRAKELLLEHEQQMTADHAPPIDDLFTDVNCGDCGAICSFALATSGTTQTCPNCGGYIDVPEL